MAYFLKQTKLKYGTYLAIYESHYDKNKKRAVNHNVKSIGNIKTLITEQISDPVAYYKSVVDQMNLDAKNKKNYSSSRRIDSSPLKYLGYSPFIKILELLDIKKYFNYLQFAYKFKFSCYDITKDLIASRLVSPCSKLKTFNEVIPNLFHHTTSSYDQILECLDFIGNNYEKIIEFTNVAVKNKYEILTDKVYFDCTNFFFEIDREDLLRRKGPSKENRSKPIVSMGLLLDSNCIPIEMKIFAGNESEKPVIRDIINNLKKRNNIKGKTIQVADKGLNCTENIVSAILNKDGYIFSKSIKQLPDKEIIWLKSENDWKNIYDKQNNLLYKFKSCIDEFPYNITDINGKKKTVYIKEKRLLTYNHKLAEKQRYEINRLVEKARGFCYYNAKKSECGECGKYINFTDNDNIKAKANINEKAIINDLELCGYNLLITSEINMADEEIYDTYHNLWKIEETFKTMKSELDARPVFVQKKNTITGHFLICYLSVLLLRIFQYLVCKNEFSVNEIMSFAKKFYVIDVEDDRYINTLSDKPLYTRLSELLDIPITNYFLYKKEIDKMVAP